MGSCGAAAECENDAPEDVDPEEHREVGADGRGAGGASRIRGIIRDWELGIGIRDWGERVVGLDRRNRRGLATPHLYSG